MPLSSEERTPPAVPRDDALNRGNDFSASLRGTRSPSTYTESDGVKAQRITEYESGSAPSTPKRQEEGPLFKVVKKNSSNGGGYPIEEFPNGMALNLLYQQTSII
jgi:hypothetical protein